MRARTSVIKLRQVVARARGTGGTEQFIGYGARCDSEQEACSEVAKPVH